MAGFCRSPPVLSGNQAQRQPARLTHRPCRPPHLSSSSSPRHLHLSRLHRAPSSPVVAPSSPPIVTRHRHPPVVTRPSPARTHPPTTHPPAIVVAAHQPCLEPVGHKRTISVDDKPANNNNNNNHHRRTPVAQHLPRPPPTHPTPSHHHPPLSHQHTRTRTVAAVPAPINHPCRPQTVSVLTPPWAAAAPGCRRPAAPGARTWPSPSPIAHPPGPPIAPTPATRTRRPNHLTAPHPLTRTRPSASTPPTRTPRTRTTAASSCPPPPPPPGPGRDRAPGLASRPSCWWTWTGRLFLITRKT